MKSNNSRSKLFFLFILLIIITGCKSTIYEVAYPALNDGKYDSEFPYKSSSDELSKIGETVKLLNSIAFYESFVLNPNEKITREELTESIIFNRSVTSGKFNKTASGTATVIYNNNGNIALLTCAHIIDFPDTIITYKFDKFGKKTKYIESISTKIQQNNYIPGLPKGGKINILAMDKENDIALVGNRFDRESTFGINAFDYPIGNAKSLEWGSFVYAFGYPMNYKMLSKAIVSSPDRDGNGSFLIDAVFNRGFSGGIILAIKDGVPNFELVGIVTSVAAEGQFVLLPDLRDNNFIVNPLIPYRGDVFLNRKLDIKYGITKAISIEIVREFVELHKENLERNGFFLDKILEKNEEE